VAVAITLPPSHPATLTSDEGHTVLTLLCSDRIVDRSPHQVFVTLIDESAFHCGVRSAYSLLKA